MTDRQRLDNLIRGRHTCICISTLEEEYALGLVREIALEYGRQMWVWCASGGIQEGLLSESLPIPNTEDAVAAMNDLADRTNRPLCVMLDPGCQLRNDRVLRAFRNLLRRFRTSGSQLVLIDAGDEFPDVVRSYSTRMDISLPDEKEIEELIRDTLRGVNREMPLSVHVGRQTLDTIIRNLRGLSRRQAAAIIVEVVAADRRFDDTDLNRILAAKRRAIGSSGLLDFVEAPVDLAEIGGLKRLKAWLLQRQNALTAQAVAFGITPPRGVLMLGVQGAGKSLSAKAIATAWQRPLLRLDVGALYDRYVGESERRLREALRQAEAMAPIILWIDEIEKAFASAATRSTDGGLSQRMFGSLLTWMQEHRAAVFIVATANDIEALPPELLRKGRFDEVIFIDLPGDEARREIFNIHLKKRKRDLAKFDSDALVAASDGFSGAEIEQAIIAALHEAFATGKDIDTGAIQRVLAESPPLSVTMAERVQELREWAAGRCLPAE